MVAIAMFGEVGVSSVRCRKASMDNAVKKILLFVLLSASSALGMAANQRSPAEEAVKILSCEGIMEETVPDDISDSAKKVTEINNSGDRQVSQVYEMKSNLLVAKGGMASDETFKLCKKSESEYVFSDECKTDELQFLRDWHAEDDHLLDSSPFLEKYPYLSYTIIRVNRTDLHVRMKTYFAHLSEREKHHGFLVTTKAELECAVRKPKI